MAAELFYFKRPDRDWLIGIYSGFGAISAKPGFKNERLCAQNVAKYKPEIINVNYPSVGSTKN
jgi:hypothetical protein